MRGVGAGFGVSTTASLMGGRLSRGLPLLIMVSFTSPQGGGQEVEVGEQEFPLVNFCAGEPAAAIIEQIEPGEGGPGVRKPAVRRGVELPEFADLRALPAADGRQNFFGRDRMGETVFERPAADLGAVELEGVQAERPAAAKL
jgi:hypothetical protein